MEKVTAMEMQTREAKNLIKKGEENLEDIQKFVGENLDEFTEAASLDYQKQAEQKMQELISKGDYENVKKIISEVEKHKQRFGFDLHKKETN